MEKIITGVIMGLIVFFAINENFKRTNFENCKRLGGKIFKKPVGKLFHEEICVLNNKIVKGSFKIGKGEEMPSDLIK